MQEQEFKKRFTAYRLSIGMILCAEQLFEEERFYALSFNNKEISRVNVIATVVDKFVSDTKPYISITIDDNTGTIRVKAFADDVALLKDIQIGDTVLVVGLLRQFNNELYILPDLVKVLDPKWLLARKLELMHEYGALYETMQKLQKLEEQELQLEQERIEEIFEEGAGSKSLRDKLLDIIREAEAQQGISIEKIILMLKEDPEKINQEIRALLEEGSIFEPKPGFLRIL
ncbi:MAG: OB-fold nucleic acid binding domain-containing protein [Candidatus Pacearchaeota archaeon]